MTFLTRGPLRHSSGEVRDKAEQLIIALYEKVGAPVRQCLSSADENTRKSLLYKQLFKAFDHCDASRGGRQVVAVTADDDNNNVRHGDSVSTKPDSGSRKRDSKVCICPLSWFYDYALISIFTSWMQKTLEKIKNVKRVGKFKNMFKTYKTFIICQCKIA